MGISGGQMFRTTLWVARGKKSQAKKGSREKNSQEGIVKAVLKWP